MKKIEAVINEGHFDRVKNALFEAGFNNLTVFPVSGRGKSGGIELQGRAGTYHVDFLNKVFILLVVQDEELPTVLTLLTNACNTGEPFQTGRVFVSHIEQMVLLGEG